MSTTVSRLLRVAEVVAETDEARSFVFDAAELDYRPGQFLTVRVPGDDRGPVARCYSLSSAPGVGAPPQVTVKRDGHGYASNWLCDHVRPGTELEVLDPAGVFTPSSLDEDLLVFAAGSGITPVMSIVRAVLARGRGRVALYYANRDENSVIFARALRELAESRPGRLTVTHWLESVQGLPTAGALGAWAAPYADREAFVCGPRPFMKAATTALKAHDVPRSRRHVEKFVSLGGDPFADAVPAGRRAAPDREPAPEAPPPVSLTVTLDDTEHTSDWPRDRTLRTTCSTPAWTRRTRAARAAAAPARAGCSPARSPCSSTTCSNPRTSGRGSRWRASRCRSPTRSRSPTNDVPETATRRPHMPIDPDVAVGADLGRSSFSWTSSDVLLYHLALGAGADPADERELRYAYESDLRVLPTFATVAENFHAAEPPAVSFPGVDIDLAKVVHGTQRVELHRPIPTAGEAVARTRIADVLDKGKAAVIVRETEVTGTDGDPLWTARSSIFARGEGGFGGERGASDRVDLPDREPDAVVDTPTLPQQALLYRLCGDRNPLHADPEFARAAGFDTPILHGLCTYGVVAKAVTDAVLDSDVTRVRSWSAKFAGIVVPGETLRTRIWRDRERLLVTATVVERDEAPALSDAVLHTA